MTTEVRTTCPYCGVGCGVIAGRTASGGVTVAGDSAHPANRGRLCSKGVALADTLSSEGRLLHPKIDGARVAWHAALTETARRLKATIDAHGPDAVAFYVSGQLLTEDYYVANKLAKGFVGTANIDTNSRLCMASAVAAHSRAFGEDAPPACYDDLGLADLVVLVGSNLAWCHPVLYQRLRDAKRLRGTKIAVIDPRRTQSCDIADIHLAIQPGADVILFNGLLVHLAHAGRIDETFVAQHTVGFADAFASASEDGESIDQVAIRCGVEPKKVAAFFDLFAKSDRAVSVFSQGVNQAHNGVDRANAILNLHLATGRIGKPGAGPFSITGQPNAMGGREVGALANQLAAHMDFGDPRQVDRVRRFWRAPQIAKREGLKAVDMFRAMREGRIKAVWIMASNPAVSMPDATLVREALDACPLVIVSDCVETMDTAAYADILLPAAAWSEKDGTVTNSERMISRQRPFLPATGEARPDWWIVSGVAAAMGWPEAFDYRGPRDVFVEHARLSAFENDGERLFNIGVAAELDESAYDRLDPFQWPCLKGRKLGKRRLFDAGVFRTPDGRARLIAVRHTSPPEKADASYPLLLNTGRYRDQWHTMTRTGLSPRLSAHRAEPCVDIHPSDAKSYGVGDGDLADVSSRLGLYRARVRLTEEQRPGEVFLPMHWSDANAGAAVACRLIPAHADPISGQPAFKATPVRLTRYPARWHALLISREPLRVEQQAYWSRWRVAGGHAMALASPRLEDRSKLIERLRLLIGDSDIVYADRQRGEERSVWLDGDATIACLSLSNRPPRVDHAWLCRSAAGENPELAMSGPFLRTSSSIAGASVHAGSVLCACTGFSACTLANAIDENRLTSIEQVAETLHAGANCGSCIPEIRRLLPPVRA